MWQVFNCSKFKDGSNPGDDVAVLIPGKVAAVFDGVSSVQVDADSGMSGGRIAALAAARALIEAVTETTSCAGDTSIVARMNQAVDLARKLHAFDAPIATTAAVVLQQQDQFQCLVVGDTMIRVNRTTVLNQPLKVDEVSIALRHAYWKIVCTRQGQTDDTELLVRKIMRFGADYAVKEGLLDTDEANSALGRVQAELSSSLLEITREIARLGLASQYQLANNLNSELGYAVLNGAPKLGRILARRLESSEIESIELASDGYDVPPADASVSAWEREHARMEHDDPYRLRLVRGIKGSTASEWSDDRTVVVFNNQGG